MPKAYVLLSGGMDSTTCLYIAAREYQHDVVGVSLDYGQHHSNEIQHASEICEHLGVKHMVHDIRGLLGIGGLTDKSKEVPDVSYAEIEGVSPTYVPFRNGALLSIAASLAQADSDAVAVYYGAHAEDAQNWAYPDCTPEFIGAMANAIYIGTYHRVRLVTPLMWMTKDEIVTVGSVYGVPWEMTWSCYKGGEKHCGTCPTCQARQQAFDIANVDDPTEYDQGPTDAYEGEDQ